MSNIFNFRHPASGQDFVLAESNFHGPYRADCHTKFASCTFFGVKDHFHGLAIHVQCVTRTDPGTGTTLVTYIIISANFLFYGFYVNVQILQITKPISDMFFVSGEFKYHEAFHAGEYFCLKYVKGQIMFAAEITDQRFVCDLGRKAENKDFCVHIFYSFVILELPFRGIGYRRL